MPNKQTSIDKTKLAQLLKLNNFDKVISELLDKEVTLDVDDKTLSVLLKKAYKKNRYNALQAMSIVLLEKGRMQSMLDAIDKKKAIEAKLYLLKWNSLMLAAWFGNQNLIEKLIKAGAQVDDDNGIMPALLVNIAKDQKKQADDSQKISIARFLLENKADPDKGSQEGHLPLITAARNGSVELVDLLLNHKATVDKRNAESLTALMLAAGLGQDAVVERLLQYPAIDVNCRITLLPDVNLNQDETPSGATALHFATKFGRTGAVELLLAQDRIDVNQTDVFGIAPLHNAVTANHIEVVRVLLAQGKNIDLNLSYPTGTTALMIAAEKGFIEIVDLLLGAKKEINLELTDRQDMTALMFAAQNGFHDIVVSLLEHGAAIHEKNTNGATALMLAACFGHANIVALLRQKGADVSARNHEGSTALMLAERNQHAEIIELLSSSQDGKKKKKKKKKKKRWAPPASVESTTAAQLEEKNSTASVAHIRKPIDKQKLETILSRNNFDHVISSLLEQGRELDIDDNVLINLLQKAYQNNWRDALQAMVIVLTELEKMHLMRRALSAKNATEPLYFPGWSSLMHAVYFGKEDQVKKLLLAGAPIDEDNGVMTPLIVAITHPTESLKWKKKFARLLLQSRANPDKGTKEGSTPLIILADEGNLALVDMLLKSKATVDKTTPKGLTALMFAVQKGHYSVVERLLKESSLDVNLGVNPPPDAKYNQKKAPPGATALYFAVMFDHPKIVHLLCSQKGIQVNKRTLLGVTPLHYAVEANKIEIVQILLGHKDINPNLTYDTGTTVLMMASNKGYIEIVRLLLKAKNKVNLNSINVNDLTALMFAATKGFDEIVELLLQHNPAPAIDQQSILGSTALMFAAHAGHLKVVELLLNQGADVSKVNEEGFTALGLAESKGHTEIFQLLWQWQDKEKKVEPTTPIRLPAEEKENAHIPAKAAEAETKVAPATPPPNVSAVAIPEKKTPAKKNNRKKKRKPIVSATPAVSVHALSLEDRKDDEIVEMLKDGYKMGCLNGLRAMAIALAKRGQAHLIDEAISAEEAEKNKIYIHGYDDLMFAVWDGDEPRVKALLEKPDTKIDGSDGSTTTPLLIAITHGNVSMVKFLLIKGANPNKKNQDGWTPLMCAAINGNEEITKRLLQKHLVRQKKVVVNQQGPEGMTALMLASRNGHFDVVYLLLRAINGRDLDLTNEEGTTALMSAAYLGHRDVVALLLKHGASISAVDQEGMTPLALAELAGHVEIVQLLQPKLTAAPPALVEEEKNVCTPVEAENGTAPVVPLETSVAVTPQTPQKKTRRNRRQRERKQKLAVSTNVPVDEEKDIPPTVETKSTSPAEIPCQRDQELATPSTNIPADEKNDTPSAVEIESTSPAEASFNFEHVESASSTTSEENVPIQKNIPALVRELLSLEERLNDAYLVEPGALKIEGALKRDTYQWLKRTWNLILWLYPKALLFGGSARGIIQHLRMQRITQDQTIIPEDPDDLDFIGALQVDTDAEENAKKLVNALRAIPIYRNKKKYRIVVKPVWHITLSHLLTGKVIECALNPTTKKWEPLPFSTKKFQIIGIPGFDPKTCQTLFRENSAYRQLFDMDPIALDRDFTPVEMCQEGALWQACHNILDSAFGGEKGAERWRMCAKEDPIKIARALRFLFAGGGRTITKEFENALQGSLKSLDTERFLFVGDRAITKEFENALQESLKSLDTDIEKLEETLRKQGIERQIAVIKHGIITQLKKVRDPEKFQALQDYVGQKSKVLCGYFEAIVADRRERNASLTYTTKPKIPQRYHQVGFFDSGPRVPIGRRPPVSLPWPLPQQRCPTSQSPMSYGMPHLLPGVLGCNGSSEVGREEDRVANSNVSAVVGLT